MLGNPLDTPAGRSRSLSAAADPQPRRAAPVLTIDDDGRGSLGDGTAARRGVRTDEKVPGHGIGLAMVRDSIELYGGALAIEARTSASARHRASARGLGATLN